MSASSCLQKEEADRQQQELDGSQRAYENLKAQEQRLEESLSHISEEVKGMPLPVSMAAANVRGLPGLFLHAHSSIEQL